jgi:hypothetical protein
MNNTINIEHVMQVIKSQDNLPIHCNIQPLNNKPIIGITDKKVINNNNSKDETIQIINNEKNPIEYIPIKTYNISNDLWSVSVSSITLVILVIILLYMKWNDNNY